MNRMNIFILLALSVLLVFAVPASATDLNAKTCHNIIGGMWSADTNTCTVAKIVSVNRDITVPAGARLITLNNGAITINKGVTITNYGYINNLKSCTITNYGTIYNKENGTFTISGGTLINDAKGTIINTGALHNWYIGNIKNAGIINSTGAGTFVNDNIITNKCGGIITGLEDTQYVIQEACELPTDNRHHDDGRYHDNQRH